MNQSLSLVELLELALLELPGNLGRSTLVEALKKSPALHLLEEGLLLHRLAKGNAILVQIHIIEETRVPEDLDLALSVIGHWGRLRELFVHGEHVSLQLVDEQVQVLPPLFLVNIHVQVVEPVEELVEEEPNCLSENPS